MAVGFRKSLLGFNCGDVISYIEKSHKAFLDKESELSAQLESISAELDLSKESYEKLLAEKELIDSKLSSFNEKYDEIERLSENIGKLYLVAQANAQAIISNSEKNAQISAKEVEKNLYTIDEAHDSLDELRKSIAKTSGDFIAEVDSLIASLGQTREQIAENTVSSEEYVNQFDEMYKSLAR